MSQTFQTRNDGQILGEIIIGKSAYRGSGSEVYAYTAHSGERGVVKLAAVGQLSGAHVVILIR